MPGNRSSRRRRQIRPRHATRGGRGEPSWRGGAAAGLSQLLDHSQAVEHIRRLLTEVDAEIAGITARAQLAADVAAYTAARSAYAEHLPDLPSALPTTVEVVSAPLTALIGEVDAARTTHDRAA
jgi:hypothetical protein